MAPGPAITPGEGQQRALCSIPRGSNPSCVSSSHGLHLRKMPLFVEKGITGILAAHSGGEKSVSLGGASPGWRQHLAKADTGRSCYRPAPGLA